MSDRLKQARRIAALRERRSERARQDASLRLGECAALADQAERIARNRSSVRMQAEQLLISDPADPQTQLWRMLATQQDRAACSAREEAEASLVTAHHDAQTARHLHERDCERARLLDGRIASAAAFADRLAEEREGEELQGRNR